MTGFILFSLLCILCFLIYPNVYHLLKNNNIEDIPSITLIRIGILCFFLLSNLLINLRYVDPGYVGIVVNLLGDKKGVEAEERHVGMHYIPAWKKLYTFPIFMQNEVWNNDKIFSFQSDEGVTVEATIGISFILEPSKIPQLFSLYRAGIEEITNIYVRNHVRDAINRFGGKLTVESLYNGETKEKLFQDVQHYVQSELEPLGFKISKIYLIGSFVFPEKVRENFNEKINAIQIAQKTENEIRATQAMAQKTIATQKGESEALIIRSEADAKARLIAAQAEADAIEMEAKAKANANNLINKSLTGDLLKFESIRKWNGTLPTAMGEGMLMPYNPFQK